MYKEIKGNVFDIQHFSLGDGPGIRTTVFLKGCALDCEWCHNPEGKLHQPQVIYNSRSCAHCEACVTACPNGCHQVCVGVHLFNSEKCIRCGKCVEVCHFGGLETVGRKMSVESVIKEVEEDITFYESSCGGMTLSGGEPLDQPAFSLALSRAAKEKNIHVCVETSGFGKTENILELSKYTDLFLFDYKATGTDCKKLIGVDNSLILKNLFSLDEQGACIVLRCPIIPTKNATREHICGIIGLAKQIKNLVEIHLEPYHNIGLEKRVRLGLLNSPEAITPPTQWEMSELRNKIEAETHTKVAII